MWNRRQLTAPRYAIGKQFDSNWRHRSSSHALMVRNLLLFATICYFSLLSESSGLSLDLSLALQQQRRNTRTMSRTAENSSVVVLFSYPGHLIASSSATKIELVSQNNPKGFAASFVNDYDLEGGCGSRQKTDTRIQLNYLRINCNTRD